jgi:hypothetical protein
VICLLHRPAPLCARKKISRAPEPPVSHLPFSLSIHFHPSSLRKLRNRHARTRHALLALRRTHGAGNRSIVGLQMSLLGDTRRALPASTQAHPCCHPSWNQEGELTSMTSARPVGKGCRGVS